jgi:virulence-associated protein VapD
MYAIAFDMVVAELEQHYGKPYNYNGAYEEIRAELRAFGFENTQGSVYLYQNGENGLAIVYKAINRLAAIDWFKKSVRDIRVFKVEDWSDFTDIVKKS